MRDGETMKDRHVIEALGRTKVIIEDGKVTYVGEPEVTFCPLFARHRGLETITREAIRENIEFRIKDFGFCTPDRSLRMKDFLSFGISELMAMCIKNGAIDAAVLVSDGAGTVVSNDPELIQGIGGRMSGMIETTPILEIVEAIGRENVLDPEKGTIDQFAGTQLAFKLGYRKVAVTLARAEDARAIRDAFGQNVILFAVHTSGLDQKDARTIFETCDIVSGCASKWVREEAKTKALLQAGTKVPIYAASEIGKEIIQRRRAQAGVKKTDGPEEPPRPLF
ncbi:MAG TPA: methanogenesis marker 8 protein [Methanomassiliicoccales archaeon]|nr:methanogenesis marker 8 protein [Methanomassiliicoccales archaeon]